MFQMILTMFSCSFHSFTCPEGMVLLNGGAFQEGVSVPNRPWHTPEKDVVVEPFRMTFIITSIGYHMEETCFLL